MNSYEKNVKYTVELYSQLEQKIQIPPIETHMLSEENCTQIPLEIERAFAKENNFKEQISINRLKSCDTFYISSFTKYTILDDKTVSLNKFYINILNFLSIKSCTIELLLPLIKLPLRSFQKSKYSSFGFYKISNTSGLLMLILLNSVFVFKVYEKKNNQIEYISLYTQKRETSDCIILLGTEHINSKEIKFNILLKPSNKFIFVLCNYENENEIVIMSKEGGEKNKEYKMERFTPSNSKYTLFIEKAQGKYLLVNKDTYDITQLKCDVDLTINQFYIVTNKEEILLFSEYVIDEGLIIVEVFKVELDEKEKCYICKTLQRMRISSEKKSTHVFIMTNDYSFTIFLSDVFFICELNSNSKLIQKVHRVDLTESFTSKVFDIHFYYNDNIPNQSHLAICKYNDFKLHSWKFISIIKVDDILSNNKMINESENKELIEEERRELENKLIDEMSTTIANELYESIAQKMQSTIDELINNKLNEIKSTFEEKHMNVLTELKAQANELEESYNENYSKISALINLIKEEIDKKEKKKKELFKINMKGFTMGNSINSNYNNNQKKENNFINNMFNNNNFGFDMQKRENNNYNIKEGNDNIFENFINNNIPQSSGNILVMMGMINQFQTYLQLQIEQTQAMSKIYEHNFNNNNKNAPYPLNIERQKEIRFESINTVKGRERDKNNSEQLISSIEDDDNKKESEKEENNDKKKEDDDNDGLKEIKSKKKRIICKKNMKNSM